MTYEDVPGEPAWFLVPGESAAGRYPLGQQVLHVRALPQRGDIDIACSVEDGRGRQLAVVRSMSKVGLLQRAAGNLR